MSCPTCDRLLSETCTVNLWLFCSRVSAFLVQVISHLHGLYHVRFSSHFHTCSLFGRFSNEFLSVSASIWSCELFSDRFRMCRDLRAGEDRQDCVYMHVLRVDLRNPPMDGVVHESYSKSAASPSIRRPAPPPPVGFSPLRCISSAHSCTSRRDRRASRVCQTHSHNISLCHTHTLTRSLVRSHTLSVIHSCTHSLTHLHTLITTCNTVQLTLTYSIVILSAVCRYAVVKVHSHLRARSNRCQLIQPSTLHSNTSATSSDQHANHRSPPFLFRAQFFRWQTLMPRCA